LGGWALRWGRKLGDGFVEGGNWKGEKNFLIKRQVAGEQTGGKFVKGRDRGPHKKGIHWSAKRCGPRKQGNTGFMVGIFSAGGY